MNVGRWRERRRCGPQVNTERPHSFRQLTSGNDRFVFDFMARKTKQTNKRNIPNKKIGSTTLGFVVHESFQQPTHPPEIRKEWHHFHVS